jgi:hypothetical protein
MSLTSLKKPSKMRIESFQYVRNELCFIFAHEKKTNQTQSTTEVIIYVKIEQEIRKCKLTQ